MARFLIVEARFYTHLNDLLIEGATAAIEAAGHSCEVVTVPGALEIPGAVAMAALAVAMLAVAASIAIRAFALPFPDTGEWAIVAMSPLTFMGAALCSHLHKHLTADIVETLPDGWLRRGLDALSSGLCFVFGAVFVVIAWDLFDYAWSSGEKLIDLGTPVAVPAAFMVAGAALIALHGAMDVWRALAGRPPGGTDPWH